MIGNLLVLKLSTSAIFPNIYNYPHIMILIKKYYVYLYKIHLSFIKNTYTIFT